jgi:hypothetical protein
MRQDNKGRFHIIISTPKVLIFNNSGGNMTSTTIWLIKFKLTKCEHEILLQQV